MRASFLLVIALGIGGALGACLLEVAPPTVQPRAEDCATVGDEDGNGAADCADPACAGDACRASCGNGRLEAGESCDDGNLIDGDGCESTCLSAVARSSYIKASNTHAADKFGFAVALSADGSTLAVGAIGESSMATGVNGDQTNQDAPSSGAVYVFARSGATWIQQAYLKASNTQSFLQFGQNLALSADGSTLAVGAPRENSAATSIDGDQADNTLSEAGAVYMFVRSGVTWAQQAYIKASNTGNTDEFGRAVALSGDGSMLAVGAWLESSAATGINGVQTDDSASYSGAAYVFTRSGTTWSQQAYIKASNTGTYDEFGCSLALSADGSILAVGAVHEASSATGINGDQLDNSASLAGAVYVFTRSGTIWSQQAYIKASNSDERDLFGNSVALSADGSTLAVSAWIEASAAVGISGDQADNSASGAGAVYVFTRSGTIWSQQAYVKASNTSEGDEFGFAVALSADGSTLAVSALGEDSAATGINGNQADDSADNSGAVYTFTRSGTTWSRTSYIKAINTEPADGFGACISLSGDGSTLAVSAPNEASAATGVGGDATSNAAEVSGAVYTYQ